MLRPRYAVVVLVERSDVSAHYTKNRVKPLPGNVS